MATEVMSRRAAEGTFKNILDRVMPGPSCHPPLAFHCPLPLLLKPSPEEPFFLGKLMVGWFPVCVGSEKVEV